MKEQSARKCRT